MKRKPGETVRELAARIRQATATCDFANNENPLDEALRTRFISSINNEAVLKTLFKINDYELNFEKAVQVATETEEAAVVPKETVYGTSSNVYSTVAQISKKRNFVKKLATSSSTSNGNARKCYRCGNSNHLFTTCRYCNIVGHLEIVCRKKAKVTAQRNVQCILVNNLLNFIDRSPKVECTVSINSQSVRLELDTATSGNFMSTHVWSESGEPELSDQYIQYHSASGHDMPIKGSFIANVFYPSSGMHADCTFLVSNSPELNLLGCTAIKTLDISVDNLLFSSQVNTISISGEAKPNFQWLQKKFETLCQQYCDVFKHELGVLRDYELEIEFKPDAKPVFKKPRSVPFAMLKDLSHALDAGITKGIWTPTQFCDWGTPVVPVRKAHVQILPLQYGYAAIYSVTVNPQLEVHRHPLPSLEDLMRRLGGGAGFTKIDLANAYNQIRLAPESRKRLALSTHRGVLLQNVMPFGIPSAPGHFQQIMDELTRDLPGVAVYLDDILVSGSTV